MIGLIIIILKNSKKIKLFVLKLLDIVFIAAVVGKLFSLIYH